MTETHVDQRQCPTRRDGRAALFTHRVAEPECQSRQRGMFHRCFTCAYNNSWVARHGLPEGAETGSEVSSAAPEALEGAPKEAPRGEVPPAMSEVAVTVRAAR